MYVQNCKSLIAYFSVIGSSLSLSSHILMACSPLSFHLVYLLYSLCVCAVHTAYAACNKLGFAWWCTKCPSSVDVIFGSAAAVICFIVLHKSKLSPSLSPSFSRIITVHFSLFRYCQHILFLFHSFFRRRRRRHFIWHSIFRAYHRMTSLTWNGNALLNFNCEMCTKYNCITLLCRFNVFACTHTLVIAFGTFGLYVPITSLTILAFNVCNASIQSFCHILQCAQRSDQFSSVQQKV